MVRGKPYLFCHQGDCEHLLTIRSVRLAHADDPRRAESYPLRTLDGRRFRRKCSMCGVFEARHVTYGDRLAPCSPCFFCETCHDTLHLDAKGAPLYDEYERYGVPSRVTRSGTRGKRGKTGKNGEGEERSFDRVVERRVTRRSSRGGDTS